MIYLLKWWEKRREGRVVKLYCVQFSRNIKCHCSSNFRRSKLQKVNTCSLTQPTIILQHFNPKKHKKRKVIDLFHLWLCWLSLVVIWIWMCWMVLDHFYSSSSGNNLCMSKELWLSISLPICSPPKVPFFGLI